MALADIGEIAWPTPWPGDNLAGFASLLLDAESEKVGAVFTVPKAGTISKVAFRTGTVTTGATLDVRLETVGTNGRPSGTLWGTTTNGAQVVADANDDTWFTTSLTLGATVSMGDLLALSIVNPAGKGAEQAAADFPEVYRAVRGHAG